MLVLMPEVGRSHCQIPCGIYGDSTRFELLSEHITTVEKSMKEITRLSTSGEVDYNQLVRWINNKEHHADEFSHIITYYFMAQRIKPVDMQETEAGREYQQRLVLMHQLLVLAMKTRQTTDLAQVVQLRSLLAEFRTAYFGAGGP
jgi:nickel superoxide dismutase